MKQRPAEKPERAAVHDLATQQAAETAAAAFHDLRQLFDEAFYEDLKVHLAAAQEGITQNGSRIDRVGSAAKRLELSQQETNQKLQALEDGIDTVDNRLATYSQQFDERWLLTEQRAAKTEQALRVLQESSQDLGNRIEKQGDRLSSDLHAATLSVHEGAEQLAQRLALLESGIVELSAKLDTLHVSHKAQTDTIGVHCIELHQRVANLEQALLAAIERESLAERERNVTMAAALQQSTTALTTHTDSQMTLLGRRFLWGPALTVFGWGVTALFIWGLLRLRR